MLVCRHGRCFPVHDAPACAGHVTGDTMETLARLASLLRNRTQAFRDQDGRALLEVLESRDRARLASHLLAEGARLAAEGVPYVEAVDRSRALGDACTRALRDVLPQDEVDAARDALDLLGDLRLALHACAYAPAADTLPDAPAVPEPSGRRERLCALVGAGVPMQALYDAIERAARGRETVLIVGESGTGKELVARALHTIAGDAPESFIAVNCAALPRDLMESELFGHRRGAFSGALESSEGLVRAAAGGTLFLDEIGELPPEAQAKLLRVIQERAVRPVGETRERTVDVRVVAATNQPPEGLVEAGRLRRDLFYRLHRVVIRAPALRSHLEDLPLLVEHLARRWQQSYGGRPKAFTAASLKRLALHEWPGNVRELENVVFAACESSAGSWVSVEDVSSLLSAQPPREESAAQTASLRDAERLAIAEALRRSEGNKALASRLLGISRKQLYVKLRVHDFS
ncbi:MAG: sigma-54 dependent transcriptional regulator [Acidobacteriota bacterium]